jgi:hypothetical protein
MIFGAFLMISDQFIIRERSQNTYAFGGGGQRFVTNLCKNIEICTVLRYEGGGGSEYSVTYFVNGPLLI